MKKTLLKVIRNHKYTFYGILAIVICASVMRVAFLSEAPIGLNHDEVTFVINARAVALTGKDLSGTWSPLSLKPISYGFPMSELPFLVVSPLLGIFQSSPFVARLPYAVFSILLVVVIVFIAIRLFGKKEAIAVGLVAAFNPWGVMFGRTAFDPPLAVFFYMLALLLILYLKNWKILFIFIPLFLAFYSYIATKIVLIPFVIIICYLGWIINKKKYLKYYLLLFLFSIILTGNFLLSLRDNSTGVRLGEISTPFDQIISKEVDNERRLTIDTPLMPLFSNKLVLYAKNSFQKYIEAYSPSRNFFNGDNNMHISLWSHGYLYYLDLIFLVLGFCFLFQKNKKYWLIFSSLILIAPLPGALHTGDPIYATRGALVYPFFIILIGLGISFFIQLFDKRFRIFIIILLLISYGVLLLNFINIYLFRFPMYNSEGADFSSRVLIKYITLSTQERKILIFTNEPDALYKDYLFYAKAYYKDNTLKIAKKFQVGDFSLDNVFFRTGCPKKSDLSGKTLVITAVSISTDCINGKILENSPVFITQLGDVGSVYRIYFDNVCNKYNLNQYPKDINLFDLNVENLTSERFCEKFIISR